jgi:hypothetical protein
MSTHLPDPKAKASDWKVWVATAQDLSKGLPEVLGC